LTLQLQGAVKIVMDLRTDIENKHVIIVEDIIDTGVYTILHLRIENRKY
jgi:hypoxanthine-guanine phosphoribosyltransferase